jgi:hypothetical protein
MRGAIPPLPNTPSWRGAQLKHRDNFTLPIGFDAHLLQIKTNYCEGKQTIQISHCMEQILPLYLLTYLLTHSLTHSMVRDIL